MFKDFWYKLLGRIAQLLGPLWPFKGGVQGDDHPDGWKAPDYTDNNTDGIDQK